MAKTTNHGVFTHIEGDLAWTIAEHRNATDAIEMTRRIMEAEAGEHELLGLTPDCERAIFWDHMLRGVRTARFDVEGVAELGEADTDGVRRKGEYLQGEDIEEWAWVHPRHVWRIRNFD